MAITKTTVTSFLLATLLATTFAHPTEECSTRGGALVKRGKKGESRSNPKRVEWDNSNWYTISEADCHKMLCDPQYAGEHVYQRQPNERASRKAYTQESRANKGPFQKGGQYGAEPVLDELTGAEDAPPRSLQVEGRTRNVYSVARPENSRQGNAIKEGYRKAEDGGAGPNEYVDVHMKGNLGPCCQAWEDKDFNACTDGRCAGKKTRDDLFDGKAKGIDMNDLPWHTTRQGGAWGFAKGFSKRDANEEPEFVRDDFNSRSELIDGDLVKTLTEVARKRDEEDARQARKREEECDSPEIVKRDSDSDYIEAGFEMDLEDLD